MSSPAKTERNAAIIKAYRAGVTKPELSARFSISRTQINRIIKQAGASKASKAERNRKIVLAYLSGETMTAIAARFGICVARVSYLVRDYGARLSREELASRTAALARRNMNDPAIRAKISDTISKRWAAGHWAGRRKIFANDPAKREDYLALRDSFGAAYARQAMGLAA